MSIVAIARGRKVGVDIERGRAGAIVVGALAPAERAESDEEFLQMWTRKEAFLKARGDGLTFAPADMDASHWRRGCLLRDEISGAWNRCQRWELRPLCVGDGYFAALAFERRECAPEFVCDFTDTARVMVNYKQR